MSSRKILGNKYIIGDVVGSGAFSTVYTCETLEPPHEKFAVKVLNQSQLKEAPGMYDAFLRECLCLRQLTYSRHVANLVEVLESTRNFYIVMDLARNGTLLSMIVKHSIQNGGGGGGGGGMRNTATTPLPPLGSRNTTTGTPSSGPHTPAVAPTSYRSGLPNSAVRKYFTQLLRGLYDIHRSGVVHRDIKPENLLLDEWFDLKITDFGFAALADSSRILTRQCGTPQYVAPEVLIGKGYVGTKVDVWSAGVTLYVMLTKRLPFNAQDHQKLFKQITEEPFPSLLVARSATASAFSRGGGGGMGQRTVSTPNVSGTLGTPPTTAATSSAAMQRCDVCVTHLLQCCLEKNPAMRWTVEELLRHPFILGYDDFNDATHVPRGVSCGPMMGGGAGGGRKAAAPLKGSFGGVPSSLQQQHHLLLPPAAASSIGHAHVGVGVTRSVPEMRSLLREQLGPRYDPFGNWKATIRKYLPIHRPSAAGAAGGTGGGGGTTRRSGEDEEEEDIEEEEQDESRQPHGRPGSVVDHDVADEEEELVDGAAVLNSNVKVEDHDHHHHAERRPPSRTKSSTSGYSRATPEVTSGSGYGAATPPVSTPLKGSIGSSYTASSNLLRRRGIGASAAGGAMERSSSERITPGTTPTDRRILNGGETRFRGKHLAAADVMGAASASSSSVDPTTPHVGGNTNTNSNATKVDAMSNRRGFRRFGKVHLAIALHILVVCFVVVVIAALKLLFGTDTKKWPIPTFVTRLVERWMGGGAGRQGGGGSGREEGEDEGGEDAYDEPGGTGTMGGSGGTTPESASSSSTPSPSRAHGSPSGAGLTPSKSMGVPSKRRP